MNYPTQKGVAFIVTVSKDRNEVTRKKVGARLLPNGFHAQKCENTVRRSFPSANAFRIYGNDGFNYFCGSL